MLLEGSIVPSELREMGELFLLPLGRVMTTSNSLEFEGTLETAPVNRILTVSL